MNNGDNDFLMTDNSNHKRTRLHDTTTVSVHSDKAGHSIQATSLEHGAVSTGNGGRGADPCSLITLCSHLRMTDTPPNQKSLLNVIGAFESLQDVVDDQVTTSISAGAS